MLTAAKSAFKRHAPPATVEHGRVLIRHCTATHSGFDSVTPQVRASKAATHHGTDTATHRSRRDHQYHSNAPTHVRAIAPCACHFFLVAEAAPGRSSQHEQRGWSRPLGPERLGPAGGGSGARRAVAEPVLRGILDNPSLYFHGYTATRPVGTKRASVVPTRERQQPAPPR
jgi:hypothetical protein